MVVCLLFVWIVVYFIVWKGIKWTGKIVYFTALFPYVILLILLIRAATLEGAGHGIKYYLKPNFTRLSDPQVWIDGGTQIFFSYAIGFGCMIALGSYNKFKNNFIRQCIAISLVNSGTSIFGGFVVFSVLGFMATQQNVDISKVAVAGPGLVFITYPKGVTQMSLSPVWSSLFFFTIFLLGIDSQFVAVESFLSNILDSIPVRFRTSKGRAIVTFIYCLVSFILGLSMVTRGGMYIFQLFDYYSASGMALLFICFLECIAIGWVFGAAKFYDVIEMMVGYRINPILFICWKFCTPALTMGILIFQVVKFTPLQYNKTYNYPAWAQGFGICLGVISMMCVPMFAMYRLWIGTGTIYEKFRQAASPELKPYQIPDQWQHQDRFWTCEDSITGDNSDDSIIQLKRHDSDLC